MTHRRVVANALVYDFAPDTPPLLAERDWALATAQVVDDISRAPLAVPFRVRVALPGPEDEIAQDGTRVRHEERGISVKLGADGTFALVTRPWLRFTPFGLPASTTVLVEAEGFAPLSLTFPVVYDQRGVIALAAIGDRVVTLSSAAGLVTGQTLLFGPAANPQYVRIRSVGAASQVTLDTGLIAAQNPGDPVFPDTFGSPPPVVAAMRRRPVTITGRVVARNTSTNVATPVVNAAVTVTDFWRTRAAVVANPVNGSMTHPTPALREFAVAIAPGALAARSVGALVGSVVLPAAPDDRPLARAAAANQPRIHVPRRQNLAAAPAPLPNRLLLIDADDPSAWEFQTVDTIEPPGGPDEAARLTLELPLAHGHREGVRVARLNPGALPPATVTVTASIRPGDRCLFLDTPMGSPPPPTLRVTGGGAVDELQSYDELSVRSDADGYFRLPPLHRMARVALTVDDGAGNVLPPIEIDPEYGESEHRVDAVFFV